MIVTADNDIRFTNAHEALVFAFNCSDQAYDRPMMNRLAAPANGSGNGLAGLEAAAQAGMIRAEVQGLGKLAEAILIARIAPRTIPCSCRSICCAGKKPNDEWTGAIAYLADQVRQTALRGCTSNGVMRRAYLVRYFTPKEQRVSLEELAAKYDIDRNTASAHNAKVAAWLAGVPAKGERAAVPGMEPIARDAIEDRLRAIGMVG